MILITCLDPILEGIFYVDELVAGADSKVIDRDYNIGSKGIIAGRILKNLNAPIYLTGYLGGLKGQLMANILKTLNIDNDFVFIKDESKSRIIIRQDKRTYKITEESPRITREEINAFYKLYNKFLDSFGIICAFGEIPTSLSDDFYFHIITMANRRNKKFILEAEGKALEYGIKAKPFMVKLERKDLEHLSKLELHFESEIIRVGLSLVEEGIEILAIDLAEKGSIILTKDKGYRLEIGEVHKSLGLDYGYMVSGFAFGLSRNYDLETIMRLGQGARIAYSQADNLDRIDMADIKSIMPRINIRKINY